ncbi:hypothetical protein [Gordonia alkanivorans]|uniref:hypothetical protein n=1 Tax=Gordonia alkanivorans TaxID=84096 RepID=UPI0004BCEF6E|nr:hypothetical protein [Gordonia alkanivorans]
MSISFTPEFDATDIAGWQITNVCGCTSKLFSSYADATAAYVQLPGYNGDDSPYLPGCGMDENDRATFRPSIHAVENHQYPTVTLANTNARGLLDRLGLPGDDSGSVDSTDLIGRILLAQALCGPDEGVPSSVAPRKSGPTLVEGGRLPGYYDDVLTRLVNVATWAMTHARPVTWQ